MQGLLRHMKICTKAPTKDVTFACRHCAKIFSSRKAMEKHEKQHTASSASPLPEPFSTWQTDLQRKGAVPTVRCFGAVPRLCRTRGGAHQTGQQVKPPFPATYAVPTPGRCSSCGYKAQSQAALIRHIEVMHARATDLGLQCSSCDRQVWLLHRRGSLCTDTLYRCFQSQMDLQVSFSVALCLRWATPVPTSHCTPIYP